MVHVGMRRGVLLHRFTFANAGTAHDGQRKTVALRFAK